MRKPRAIIIEDDPEFRTHLHLLLFWYCRNYLDFVGEAYNVADGILAIQQYKPDIVFLDIELPDGVGFDVLDAFPDDVRNLRFYTLIISAYEQYRSRAFRYRVVEYLVKGFSTEQFVDTIAHLLEVMERDSFDENEQSEKMVFFPTKNNGIVQLFPSTIVLVETIRNGTKLILNDTREIEIDQKMYQLEQRLNAFHFFMRVNKSFIINLQYVFKVHCLANPKKACFELENYDKTVHIGETYLPKVRAIFDQSI
jgi:two-component system LytT family response regulator